MGPRAFEKCSANPYALLFGVVLVASDEILTQTSLLTSRNLLPNVQGSLGRSRPEAQGVSMWCLSGQSEGLP